MLISNLKWTSLLMACAVVAVVLAVSAEGRSVAGDNPRPSAVSRRVLAPVAAKPTEWKVVFTLEHTHPVTAVAANANLIVVAHMKDGPQKGGVRLWDGQTGKESDLDYSRSWQVPPRYLRFTTQEGYFVAGIEGAASHYRARPGGYATDTLGSFDMVACSADANTVLTRYTDGWKKRNKPNQLSLHVNPWVGGQNALNPLAVFEEECKTITHADVSADDRRVAIAGDDAVIRVYNRNNLQLLRKITLPKNTKITAVRFSADGERLAVVGEAGFVKLFDDAGTEGAELKGHKGTVAAVAFSPDGKSVVTAVGKVARVFDPATGKSVAELVGHTDDITAVAFSTDGKRIVTGSADKTAKVWERKE
jgi:WD40 repeat protein